MRYETNKPKIFNFDMHLPPKTVRDDVVVLATFGVSMPPVRVENLRLVRKNGALKIWARGDDFKFFGWAERMIVEAALKTVRDSIGGNHLEMETDTDD